MPVNAAEAIVICLASCVAQCIINCMTLMTAGAACKPDQKACNGSFQGIASLINCIICIAAIYFMFFRK